MSHVYVISKGKIPRKHKKTKSKGDDPTLAPMIRAIKVLRSTTTFDPTHPQNFERQRKSQTILGRLAPMLGTKWQPIPVGSLEGAWTHPPHPHPSRVILYCHGGGFTSGNLSYCRILAARLAHATGCSVLSYAYRLAPEHPFPAAIDDTLTAWDYLTYHGYDPSQIIVAGDSAGGNLALVLVGELKTRGRKCPRALVLFSPWTDLTTSGRSYQSCAPLDPIITMEYLQEIRRAYAGDHNPATPLLSPLFGDLTGYPPTLLQVGSHEVLLSDSIRLRNQFYACGVDCSLEVWHDMWHVFQLLPLPKAAHALERVGEFVKALPL